MSEGTLKVLVVEDESEIREFLISQFIDAGALAVGLPSGDQVLQTLESFQPNVVLLDQMMPGKSGREIINEIRSSARFSETPIMMVTGLDGEAEKIQALEMGADDYVTKPFNVRELTARVRAVLRRVQKSTSEPDVLRVADIVLDRSGMTVKVAERNVDLTKSEFELLAAFMSAPGKVFSRLDLLDRVSGEAYEGYERTIDVHMRNLRTKIEPDPKHPKYIETVYGMGYRFSTQKSAGD